MSTLSGIPAHFIQSGPEGGDPLCLSTLRKQNPHVLVPTPAVTEQGEILIPELLMTNREELCTCSNVALTVVANRKLAYSSFNCVHDDKTR